MPYADIEKRRANDRARNVRRREYFRLRYWKNPERARASGREYWKNNPEKAAERNAIRAERIRARRDKYGQLAKIGLGPKDCAELLSEKTHCRMCGDAASNFHLDHIIPKSRGGTNARENLQWLCKSCNMAKSDMTPAEFISHIRKILSRIQ